ncbi:MAG: ABC transporter ATP-binding protein/permease [Chloroflexi bacterium]|nr:ABC transporter ATP-binding protein/permease [Chloroflexota bacterium]
MLKPLLRLTEFLYPYRYRIAASLVLLLGLTAAQMVFPAVIQKVIDQGLSSGDTHILVTSTLIILGLGLGSAVLSYGQRFLTEWVANHVAYDIRNRLFDHIQNLPFAYHDHISSGQLISRCIEDVRSIQVFTGQGVLEIVRIVLLSFAILVVLFTANAHLAWIALLPMIPMVIVTIQYGIRIERFYLAIDNALGELSSRLQENVTGAQVVRAFAREPYEIDRFDSANRTLFSARIATIGEWSKIMPTTTFLVTIGTLLILWFGGQMVLRGQLTLGELVAFNSYLLLLSMPAQNLGWLVNTAGEASAGVQRIMEILDRKPEIQSPPGAIHLPALQGRVEFRDVSFNYTAEKSQALHHIDLTVEPNQVVALIGPTGSGKTSLINLIPRFYDIQEGAILIDGYDVKQVDLTSLRRQIGIVLQTSLLFSTTIRENLAYGRPDASLDEIITAAKSAQAHEFILALPDGYETIVGERGVTLSGGQRQRIAIGRALLMDPRILILDDSTSSVDTQTEHQIQAALSRLMEGRTTFIIAQRLSTVRRADTILVMDQGRIVERGTHAVLLTQDGLYRQIYELQLRDQERFQEEMEHISGSGIYDSEPPDNEDQEASD